jgi:hypothetical protein
MGDDQSRNGIARRQGRLVINDHTTRAPSGDLAFGLSFHWSCALDGSLITC